MAGKDGEMIALDAIVESPYLPRKNYDQASLEAFSRELEEDGLMHPILVYRLPEGMFGLQAGSRRIRAARMRGFTHIAARVADAASPREVVVLALAENVQREDLEPLEEAAAYLWLHTEYGMNIEAIASSIHKPPRYVRDRFKVLDTAPQVQQLVADGELAFKIGVVLASVPEGEQQVDIAHEAMRNNLAPDDVRNLIRERSTGLVGSKPNYTRQTLTVAKYRLSLLHTMQKIERTFAGIEKLATTPDERAALMKAHVELEALSQKCRNRISEMGRAAPQNLKVGGGNFSTASNHGQEWPTDHLRRIHAAQRPSDEVLATQLGRTVGAIRKMRKLTRNKKSR
ncbi:MAG TPA: ParB/RepB/Spo0J family partition protein [Candidatus Paceibacterota bacterium]